jgi:hypothetical protein
MKLDLARRGNGQAGSRRPEANAQQRDSVHGSFSARSSLAQETNLASHHFISAAYASIETLVFSAPWIASHIGRRFAPNRWLAMTLRADTQDRHCGARSQRSARNARNASS